MLENTSKMNLDYTSGVVGTSVEQNDGLFRGGLKIINQSIEVQTLGFSFVVSVFLELKSRIVENVLVIRPSGVRQIDSS
mgnify:CR=1 FL=1